MQTFAFYVTNPFALFCHLNLFLSKYFSKSVCRFYSRVCYSGPLWIGIKPLASEVKLSCIIISNYLSWTILNFSFCIPYFTVKLLLFTIYNMVYPRQQFDIKNSKKHAVNISSKASLNIT